MNSHSFSYEVLILVTFPRDQGTGVLYTCCVILPSQDIFNETTVQSWWCIVASYRSVTFLLRFSFYTTMQKKLFFFFFSSPSHQDITTQLYMLSVLEVN